MPEEVINEQTQENFLEEPVVEEEIGEEEERAEEEESPENLFANKFKTAEDLEKGYKELERVLGKIGNEKRTLEEYITQVQQQAQENPEYLAEKERLLLEEAAKNPLGVVTAIVEELVSRKLGKYEQTMVGLKIEKAVENLEINLAKQGIDFEEYREAFADYVDDLIAKFPEFDNREDLLPVAWSSFMGERHGMKVLEKIKQKTLENNKELEKKRKIASSTLTTSGKNKTGLSVGEAIAQRIMGSPSKGIFG